MSRARINSATSTTTFLNHQQPTLPSVGGWLRMQLWKDVWLVQWIHPLLATSFSFQWQSKFGMQLQPLTSMEMMQPKFMNSSGEWHDSGRVVALWKNTTMISKVYGGRLISVVPIQCNVQQISNILTICCRRIRYILFLMVWMINLIILEVMCCSLSHFPIQETPEREQRKGIKLFIPVTIQPDKDIQRRPAPLISKQYPFFLP